MQSDAIDHSAMTDDDSARSQIPSAEASSPSVSSPPASRLLYKDSVQAIIAFLPVSDLRSANSVSHLWHAAVSAVRHADVVRVARAIRAGLFSGEEQQQQTAARELRILLSSTKDQSAFLPVLVQAAVVRQLVSLLSHPNAELVIDCAWSLINVAGGTSDRTRLVVEQGAIPPLVALIASSNVHVQEQALWALANVAADSAAMQDRVLAAGTLSAVLAAAPEAREPLQRTIAFLIANLCGGKPAPEWAAVCPALPCLAQLLQSEDVMTLSDTARSAPYTAC